MKQTLSYVWVLVLATGGLVASACSDDSSSGTENSAGNAGDPGTSTGGKTGGSTSGGSTSGGSTSGGSSNKAGNNSGGKAGGGSAGTSSVGGAAEGGAGGANDGGGVGVDSAGAAGSDAGAGGAGGAGQPALVYACGSADQFQKTCSAWVAANCDTPTVCSDCVDALTTDRVGFQTDPPCDTCNAKYDAFYQCQVDAFESGMLDFGVVCVEGYPDSTDNCYPLLDDAIACEGYVGSQDVCPATWPPQ